MAAAQANGYPIAQSHPELLWGHIEDILRKHLDQRDGWSFGGYESPSQALIKHGGGKSIRPGKCKECKGTGHERLGMVRIPCEKCGGTGQLVVMEPLSSSATRVCRACNGSGRWRKKGRWQVVDGKQRWVPNPDYYAIEQRPEDPGYPHRDLEVCTECDGKGYVTDVDAAKKSALTSLGVSLETRLQSWVQPTMDQLDKDEPRSALVLDIAFGSVGTETERDGKARSVALWTLTEAGQKLAAMHRFEVVQLRDGLGRPILNELRQPIHVRRLRFRKAIQGILHALDPDMERDDFTEALIRTAEDEARTMMLIARRALFQADAKANWRVLRVAEAMDRRAQKKGTH